MVWARSCNRLGVQRRGVVTRREGGGGEKTRKKGTNSKRTSWRTGGGEEEEEEEDGSSRVGVNAPRNGFLVGVCVVSSTVPLVGKPYFRRNEQ